MKRKIMKGITSNVKKTDISQELRVNQLQKMKSDFCSSSKLFNKPSCDYFSFELSESYYFLLLF